ncbi:DUF732 domain-containing protein [Mycobacterium shinjukuense]|uniref:DUF732 domain-containing protein n=1 Tax=Mycobacterium shinjukuense TaxID=398694 RepID=A0A7I7MPE8_9MYCO|nr:DUF732 domain-containing protein [Mycobacterium shinjukuense]MCV6984165.1 DUF732 domain-containing protein [Mycobacterium shinjukuense]ORB70255.1 hypothetical protein BST45_07015 [Mycobacterium shinjukuense]BBX74118.1 hypothetical protein MSHI_20240 [Mycobacterium shinjukuense]
MRLLLVLAGIAVAIGLAAPAYADRSDDEFLVSLRAAGLTYPDATLAIAAGRSVCQAVAQGKPAADVVKDVQTANPGLLGESAATFTAIAAHIYCPKVLKGGGS